MIDQLQVHMNQFIKIHYGPEQNFSGRLEHIDAAGDTCTLYNETGQAVIHAKISTATAITVVKERAPAAPSPHYNTQYDAPLRDPYYEQSCYPPATQTRLNNSAYQRRK